MGSTTLATSFILTVKVPQPDYRHPNLPVDNWTHGHFMLCRGFSSGWWICTHRSSGYEPDEILLLQPATNSLCLVSINIHQGDPKIQASPNLSIARSRRPSILFVKPRIIVWRHHRTRALATAPLRDFSRVYYSDPNEI